MFSNVEIERIIEAFIYEQNRLQGDDPIYFACTGYFAAFNLNSLGQKQLDIIQDFLFKWGKMGRTGSKSKIPALASTIGNHENFLTRVRKQDLHSINIEPDKQTIAEIFEDLNSLVGPISASKVLHLICPGFFPLWDDGIIDGCNSSKQFKYKDKKANLIEMVHKENTKIVKDRPVMDTILLWSSHNLSLTNTSIYLCRFKQY